MEHMRLQSSQLQHRGADGSLACPGIITLDYQAAVQAD
jgi:hypothetical protein